jgi:glutaminyl-peptide cyclotransferase
LNQEAVIKFIIIFFGSTLLSQSVPYFDAEKAYGYIVEQCDLGPRYPGSPGQESFRVYLTDFLNRQKADTTIYYEHTIQHPYEDKNVKLYNFLSRFNLESDNRIMLMAHWDTREIADRDANPENHDKPILGANDGGSGVAVLMVLAEIISNNELSNIGIDLLFVDGEDMGRSGDIENYCIGSTKFCEVIPEPEPQHAICLDMIADHDLSLPVEYYSYIQAPFLVKEIWAIANEMGYTQFKNELTGPIYDDHRALYLNSRIPAIDIIDFDYPHWHTLQDTPENCSEKSLKIVGEVMCEYIYRKDYENK